jgi:hypothetical protein
MLTITRHETKREAPGGGEGASLWSPGGGQKETVGARELRLREEKLSLRREKLNLGREKIKPKTPMIKPN